MKIRTSCLCADPATTRFTMRWETDDPQGAGLNLWTGLPIGTARSIVRKIRNSKGVLRRIIWMWYDILIIMNRKLQIVM